MSNSWAELDQNNKPTLTAVTDDSNQYIQRILVDPATGRVLVSAAGSGTGTVNSVTDGTTTVSSPTQIDFTSGATVSNLGAGVVGVAISASGGNPSLPFNSIQYNNSGSFGGSSHATLDSSGNLTALGYLSTGIYTGAYSDGIVVDYNNPDGRIIVGSADTLSFYNNGISSPFKLGGFSTGGNFTATGTIGGTNFSGTSSGSNTGDQNLSTYALKDGSNWTFASQAIGDIVYASSTTAFTRLAAVATGQPLISKGVTTAPAYAGYTFSATAAATYTFPGATSTLARTDAAQTFTGVQTFSSAPVLSTGTVTVSGNTITFPSTASTLSTLGANTYTGTQTINVAGNALAANNTTSVASNQVASFLAANTIAGSTGQVFFTVGVAATTNNSFTPAFHYAGAGSASNYGFFNIYGGSPSLAFFPGQGVTIGQSAPTTAPANGLAVGSSGQLTIDASGNLSTTGTATAINHISGYTTTATAGTTTTMTIASTYQQYWTGSSAQTIKLPTTSVVAGGQYYISNTGTGVLTVQSSGANTILLLGAGQSATFTAVVATPTTAANWAFSLIDVIGINTAITATSNAATVNLAYKTNTITNNSAATLTITLPTAGAVDGMMRAVRIFPSTAVAQTLTFVNSENSAITSVPANTGASTTIPIMVGFIYNAGTSKWTCCASS